MKRVLILGDSRNTVAAKTIERVLSNIRNMVQLQKFDLYAKDVNISQIEADFAFVFGGDGSILRTVQLLGANQIPIVGVNVGKFGFLTEFSVKEFLNALPEVLSGKRAPSHRLMLYGEVKRKGTSDISDLYAVNEISVVRTGSLSMIRTRLFIDETEVTSYDGDGVIVATPTGSTAYSLSCGGPIIIPGTDAFSITPINPHTLTNRPLVVSAKVKVELEVDSKYGEVALSVDGQSNIPLYQGDKVSIKKSKRTFKLVENCSFYSTIRQKLNWGGTPNYGKD